MIIKAKTQNATFPEVSTHIKFESRFEIRGPKLTPTPIIWLKGKGKQQIPFSFLAIRTSEMIMTSQHQNYDDVVGTIDDGQPCSTEY